MLTGSEGVFLIQPLIIYTAGIKLFMHMAASGTNRGLATFACFAVCVPLVALASEVFYRLFDIPSMAVAKEAWAWIRK